MCSVYRCAYSFLSLYSRLILSVLRRFSPLWLKMAWMCEDVIAAQVRAEHDVVLVVAAKGRLLEAVEEQLDVAAAAEGVLVVLDLGRELEDEALPLEVDTLGILADVE